MKKTFRVLSGFLVFVLMAGFLTGCMDSTKGHDGFRVAMVTDTGGVNDSSFNQSAWEGLTKLGIDTGAVVRYTESKQNGDFLTNLDRSVDNDYDLIWGIGMAMSSTLEREARLNPNQYFGLVDSTIEDTPENVLTVTFKSQDAAFLVGYIAALTTKTNQVGFIGGLQNSIIDQFEYGYRAGVALGAKERNVNIDVQVQYAQSYSDAAKAKQIALKMYSSGCDIIFHASGQSGNGMIEAAKDLNKWAIGVDCDQSSLAPDNVLTSALKRVDNAVYSISQKLMEGDTTIFGKNHEFGLAEDGVGIPENNKNMDPAVYQKAMELKQKVKDGKITPPLNQQQYQEYLKTLE